MLNEREIIADLRSLVAKEVLRMHPDINFARTYEYLSRRRNFPAEKVNLWGWSPRLVSLAWEACKYDDLPRCRACDTVLPSHLRLSAKYCGNACRVAAHRKRKRHQTGYAAVSSRS